MGSTQYPWKLRHLVDPPPVLWARGRLDLLEKKSLAVVGSRACTEYGREMTEAIVSPVARAGVVIISGLALGVDGLAHAAALDTGGGTVAILGNGIDVVYPKTNRALYTRIAEEGLLLTEFEPGTKPKKWHFPQRNRIIGMLPDAVLVIEATATSGSLITVEHAQDSNNVMAVPGPVGRPTSEGTNALIRDGGHLVTSAADVLSFMHVRNLLPEEPPPEAELVLDEQQRRVVKSMTREGQHVESIARKAKLPTAEVALTLLQLELSGWARPLPGSRYALSR